LRPCAQWRGDGGRQDGCSRGALAPGQPATPGGGKTPPIVAMGLGSLPPGISPRERGKGAKARGQGGRATRARRSSCGGRR
jgi:hypothetical protein